MPFCLFNFSGLFEFIHAGVARSSYGKMSSARIAMNLIARLEGGVLALWAMGGLVFIPVEPKESIERVAFFYRTKALVLVALSFFQLCELGFKFSQSIQKSFEIQQPMKQHFEFV